MIPPLWILLPLLFLGGIVSTIAGGGLGLLLTITSTFFLDVRMSIVLTALLGFTIQAAKIAHFHKHTRWDIVGWYLSLGIPLSIIGGWLLFRVPQRALEIALGILCIAYVLSHFFHALPKVTPSRTSLILLGGLNGFVGGIIGHGALLRMSALLSFGLTKESFVATSSIIALLLNAGKSSVYAWQFPWSMTAVRLLILAIPTVLIAVGIGKKLLKHVSPELFEKLLLAIMFFGGIHLLLP